MQSGSYKMVSNDFKRNGTTRNRALLIAAESDVAPQETGISKPRGSGDVEIPERDKAENTLKRCALEIAPYKKIEQRSNPH